MLEYLSLSISDREDFCRQAPEVLNLNLTPAIIEKDFWVCFTLKVLNELPSLQNHLTFKGGTSLSKGWGLINRFSEDLDLVIDRGLIGMAPPNGPEDETVNNQKKKKLKELKEKTNQLINSTIVPEFEQALKSILQEEQYKVNLLTNGNELCIEFEYPGSFIGQLNAIKPIVLIEILTKSDTFPSEVKAITPFVFQAFPQTTDNANFQINCLKPERTLVEKILLIYESLKGKNRTLRNPSRHLYDISMLWRYLQDPASAIDRALLEAVVAHRKTYYSYGFDYADVLNGEMNLTPSEEILIRWQADYKNTDEMYYKAPPEFNELIATLKQIEHSLTL